MKTNRKDLLIGAVILVSLIAAIIWARRSADESLVAIQTPTPAITEEELERGFNVDIPDNLEKANLSDVSGGTGAGLATRNFENGVFTLTVLTDLPDLSSGEFYEGWLQRGREGDANYAFVSLGKMRVAKGGWLLDFESRVNYSDYDKVVISREKVFDQKPEVKVLEGGF